MIEQSLYPNDPREYPPFLAHSRMKIDAAVVDDEIFLFLVSKDRTGHKSKLVQSPFRCRGYFCRHVARYFDDEKVRENIAPSLTCEGTI